MTGTLPVVTSGPLAKARFHNALICRAAGAALPMGAMPVLARRRSKDSHAESWQIFYGDVQVGTIKSRTGNPWATPSWELRILSGQQSGRVYERHGCDFRQSPRRLRSGVASLSGEANGSRF
jgi:hypothetical protein